MSMRFNNSDIWGPCHKRTVNQNSVFQSVFSHREGSTNQNIKIKSEVFFSKLFNKRAILQKGKAIDCKKNLTFTLL